MSATVRSRALSKVVEYVAELEVRLGAIYALERIAKDLEKDLLTPMEVLTGFFARTHEITAELASIRNKSK